MFWGIIEEMSSLVDGKKPAKSASESKAKSKKVSDKVAVIIPNWNGAKEIGKCLESLQKQSLKPHIIVVDNGSEDDSVKIIEEKYAAVELIKNPTNLGFAGGVNTGFKKALKDGFKYVATLNNDAFADKEWLKNLVQELDHNHKVGIATCKLLTADGKKIDSTGDCYTAWGLPYPRGRGEKDEGQYDAKTEIFAASGGASIYRAEMLDKIGLFDTDFFAYYEDVDLSFRAQLAGWQARYVPEAKAYHQISATSSKIKGFSTYQTMKNLQLLLYKNVPKKYLGKVGRRFFLAETLFFLRALTRGQGISAFKGDAKGTFLLFKVFKERKPILKNKKVTDEYIWNMFDHDLPPNAAALRRLRSRWWRLRGKKVTHSENPAKLN